MSSSEEVVDNTETYRRESLQTICKNNSIALTDNSSEHAASFMETVFRRESIVPIINWKESDDSITILHSKTKKQIMFPDSVTSYGTILGINITKRKLASLIIVLLLATIAIIVVLTIPRNSVELLSNKRNSVSAIPTVPIEQPLTAPKFPKSIATQNDVQKDLQNNVEVTASASNSANSAEKTPTTPQEPATIPDSVPIPPVTIPDPVPIVSPPPPPPPSNPAQPTLLGCYNDNGGAEANFRDANFGDMKYRLLLQSKGLIKTPEDCAELCKGYKLYGVQNGDQCWCDDQFNPLLELGKLKTGDKRCNKKCSGSNDMCGGFNLANVYQQSAGN